MAAGYWAAGWLEVVGVVREVVGDMMIPCTFEVLDWRREIDFALEEFLVTDLAARQTVMGVLVAALKMTVIVAMVVVAASSAPIEGPLTTRLPLLQIVIRDVSLPRGAHARFSAASAAKVMQLWWRPLPRHLAALPCSSIFD